MNKKINLKALSAYIGTALLSLAILFIILRLWKANLRVPLSSGWDANFTATIIKGLIDNGWYLQNSFIGVPTGMNFYDYEVSRVLMMLAVRAIAIFTSDYALVQNLFYILTFPLAALSALIVFRSFKFSFPPAIVGSLLFAFAPYHLIRGEAHLFLSAYFLIPLGTLVAIWLIEGKTLLIQKKNNRYGLLLDKKSVSAIIIVLIISSGGIYYAFFTTFFLILAGSYIYLAKKEFRFIFTTLTLILIMFVGITANFIPRIANDFRSGKNLEIAKRESMEAEMYGLKLTRLILPVSDHRIPLLSTIKNEYNLNFPATIETDSAALGTIGTLGFLSLILTFIYRREKETDSPGDNDLIKNLGVLNISAVLLATVGGFSSILAVIAIPQIRGYTRISIFIAFFSLTAVVFFLDGIYKKFLKKRYGRLAGISILSLILIVGILDQTSDSMVPNYRVIEAKFNSQRDFISDIESKLPKESMIFQLPYVAFPESPPTNRMVDYDHFASGYLHSKDLKWSYGSIRGRYGDQWQKLAASMSVPDFIEMIALSGFRGIMLDRYGFIPGDDELEVGLRVEIDKKPVVSKDKRYVFFDLQGQNSMIETTLSRAELMSKTERARYPITTEWRGDFYELEVDDSDQWRWSGKEGDLLIINVLEKERHVRIEMKFSTLDEHGSELSIKSRKTSDALQISSSPKHFSQELTLIKGRNLVRITSNDKVSQTPGEDRKLFFKVSDFTIEEIDP